MGHVRNLRKHMTKSTADPAYKLRTQKSVSTVPFVDPAVAKQP